MKQRAGKRKPLQSRSAENLRPSATAGMGSSRPQQPKSQMGGGVVGKSRSTQELVSDSLREREPHSPPRDAVRSGRYTNRRPPPGRVGLQQPSSAKEKPLSEEERERAVEAMHREFSAKQKAVLNGLPPGSKEEVSSISAS